VRPGEQLRYLILAAQREGNRMLAAAVKPLGLTPAWAEVIAVLDRHEPLTIRELGLMLICEGDHPSRLVNRMITAGLLATEAQPGDDRARLLRLTPAARNLIPPLRTIEDQFHSAIEERCDPTALEACRTVLSGFVEGLPAGDALQNRNRGRSQP